MALIGDKIALFRIAYGQSLIVSWHNPMRTVSGQSWLHGAQKKGAGQALRLAQPAEPKKRVT